MADDGAIKKDISVQDAKSDPTAWATTRAKSPAFNFIPTTKEDVSNIARDEASLALASQYSKEIQKTIFGNNRNVDLAELAFLTPDEKKENKAYTALHEGFLHLAEDGKLIYVFLDEEINQPRAIDVTGKTDTPEFKNIEKARISATTKEVAGKFYESTQGKLTGLSDPSVGFINEAKDFKLHVFKENDQIQVRLVTKDYQDQFSQELSFAGGQTSEKAKNENLGLAVAVANAPPALATTNWTLTPGLGQTTPVLQPGQSATITLDGAAQAKLANDAILKGMQSSLDWSKVTAEPDNAGTGDHNNDDHGGGGGNDDDNDKNYEEDPEVEGKPDPNNLVNPVASGKPAAPVGSNDGGTGAANNQLLNKADMGYLGTALALSLAGGRIRWVRKQNEQGNTSEIRKERKGLIKEEKALEKQNLDYDKKRAELPEDRRTIAQKRSEAKELEAQKEEKIKAGTPADGEEIKALEKKINALQEEVAAYDKKRQEIAEKKAEVRKLEAEKARASEADAKAMEEKIKALQDEISQDPREKLAEEAKKLRKDINANRSHKDDLEERRLAAKDEYWKKKGKNAPGDKTLGLEQPEATPAEETKPAVAAEEETVKTKAREGAFAEEEQILRDRRENLRKQSEDLGHRPDQGKTTEQKQAFREWIEKQYKIKLEIEATERALGNLESAVKHQGNLDHVASELPEFEKELADAENELRQKQADAEKTLNDLKEKPVELDRELKQQLQETEAKIAEKRAALQKAAVESATRGESPVELARDPQILRELHEARARKTALEESIKNNQLEIDSINDDPEVRRAQEAAQEAKAKHAEIENKVKIIDDYMERAQAKIQADMQIVEDNIVKQHQQSLNETRLTIENLENQRAQLRAEIQAGEQLQASEQLIEKQQAQAEENLKEAQENLKRKQDNANKTRGELEESRQKIKNFENNKPTDTRELIETNNRLNGQHQKKEAELTDKINEETEARKKVEDTEERVKTAKEKAKQTKQKAEEWKTREEAAKKAAEDIKNKIVEHEKLLAEEQAGETARQQRNTESRAKAQAEQNSGGGGRNRRGGIFPSTDTNPVPTGKTSPSTLSHSKNGVQVGAPDIKAGATPASDPNAPKGATPTRPAIKGGTPPSGSPGNPPPPPTAPLINLEEAARLKRHRELHEEAKRQLTEENKIRPDQPRSDDRDLIERRQRQLIAEDQANNRPAFEDSQHKQSHTINDADGKPVELSVKQENGVKTIVETLADGTKSEKSVGEFIKQRPQAAVEMGFAREVPTEVIRAPSRAAGWIHNGVGGGMLVGFSVIGAHHAWQEGDKTGLAIHTTGAAVGTTQLVTTFTKLGSPALRAGASKAVLPLMIIEGAYRVSKEDGSWLMVERDSDGALRVNNKGSRTLAVGASIGAGVAASSVITGGALAGGVVIGGAAGAAGAVLAPVAVAIAVGYTADAAHDVHVQWKSVYDSIARDTKGGKTTQQTRDALAKQGVKIDESNVFQNYRMFAGTLQTASHRIDLEKLKAIDPKYASIKKFSNGTISIKDLQTLNMGDQRIRDLCYNAIKEEKDHQAKIQYNYSSSLPNWMRSGENVQKHAMATREVKAAESALAEFAEFRKAYPPINNDQQKAESSKASFNNASTGRVYTEGQLWGRSKNHNDDITVAKAPNSNLMMVASKTPNGVKIQVYQGDGQGHYALLKTASGQSLTTDINGKRYKFDAFFETGMNKLDIYEQRGGSGDGFARVGQHHEKKDVALPGAPNVRDQFQNVAKPPEGQLANSGQKMKNDIGVGKHS